MEPFFPIYRTFIYLFFFPQCDFQVVGLKKRRDTSAGAESNGVFSETHASKVSTVRNFKSRVLNCSLNTFRLYSCGILYSDQMMLIEIS